MTKHLFEVFLFPVGAKPKNKQQDKAKILANHSVVTVAYFMFKGQRLYIAEDLGIRRRIDSRN